MARRSLRPAGRLEISVAGRALLAHGAAGLIVAVVVAVGGGVFGIDFDPLVLVLVAALVVVAWWLSDLVDGWSPRMPWSRLDQPITGRYVGSDARTRRLETVIASADQAHQMGNRNLQQSLRDVAASRLARQGLGTPEPFADPRLSRRLATYLSAADPPSVSRRTLHAYLKEISAL